MSFPNYWRTFQERGKSTHLEGISDHALCGADLAGDNMVWDKNPMLLSQGKHLVTCVHCRQLIEIVQKHISKKYTKLNY